MLPKVVLLQRLAEGGVIAVIRKIPSDKLEQVAESLIAGGVTALEITVDAPDAYEIIQKLSSQFKNQAIVGAGTVLDSESALLAINSGADFIFSPTLNQDVIRTALRYGKIAVPGVMTPTEALTAIEWGADAVKIFPAANLGVKFIKDIKAPLPQIPIIPTGGINLENVTEFTKAGVISVGLGGNLLDEKVIEESDFAKITDLAAQYIGAVKEARQILK